MSYLTYVAVFGAAVTIFLWLRDARIFFRTGLAGYRKAAYWGVGRIAREKIWGNSDGMLERFLGSVPINRANKK
jgi:hypothetical protein